MTRLPTIALALAVSSLFAQDTTWHDPSPHQVRMIPVDTGVDLEVLDWGGSGRPLVFLAGLGNTAHVFDDFAPKFTSNHHVYGITRRGFGESSRPASGYDAYRLGDDVVAVLDALHLQAPVLAGHSIAGEELSSVITRHPGRVAGVIYLDAIYPYAFDNGKGWSMDDLRGAQKDLPEPAKPSAADRASLTAWRAWLQKSSGLQFPEAEAHSQLTTPPSRAGAPILSGAKTFTDLPGPILAICAYPQSMPAQFGHLDTPEKRARMQEHLDQIMAGAGKQIAAFEAAEPNARVIKIAHANHYVFISNEPQVLTEMNHFLQSLK